MDEFNKFENDIRRKVDNIRKYTFCKFTHYFDIYDRHFYKFKGRKPNILEIGVNKGGSLELWGDLPTDSSKLEFRKRVNSITYYDCVVVLEFKRDNKCPTLIDVEGKHSPWE